MPWILRKAASDQQGSPRKVVTFRAEIEYHLFDKRQQRILTHALAAFLDISPEDIQILEIESGSVILTLELPTPAANTLLNAIAEREPRLDRVFSVFRQPRQPLIMVEGSGHLIFEGASPSTTDGTDFGIVGIGSVVTQTFTVRNVGTSQLTLGQIEAPAGFEVARTPASLPAGASDEIVIKFNPSSAGLKTGQITLKSTDPNESPLTFRIAGTVEPPMDANGSGAKRLVVFLSSTWDDLKTHRAKCIDVMVRLRDELNMDWVGMEAFGATFPAAKDFCLEQVRRSDLYVGVFGARYGYVDEPSGFSATELEYREAMEFDVPCLIYVIDPNATVRVKLKDVDKGINALRLDNLKSSVRDFAKGHMVNFFASEDDLATRLSVDLIRAVNMIRSGNVAADLKTNMEAAITRGVAFVCDMENLATGGWSYHQVGGSSAWDTAFSLVALAASGREHIMAQLHRGHHFLLSARNRSGGWRSCWEDNPDASSTMDTALAISALIESGYEEQPWEVWRSSDYLAAAQQPCGGWSYTFGVGPPATAATAWAVTALIKAGWSPSTDVVQRAMRWILEGQRFDGGWGTDRNSIFSTIGKTRDALMALAVSRSPEAQGAVESAKRWLLSAREAFSSPEDFARNIGMDPQGYNPVVENIVLFLEGAFFANAPPGETIVRQDLAWLSSRRLWSNTARAISCLCHYRQWLK